jgi:hypothetical protein
LAHDQAPPAPLGITSIVFAPKSRERRSEVPRALAQGPTATAAKLSSRRFVPPAAVGCVLVVIGLLLPAIADASAPIDSFSAIPSTTQAGGHPDVLVEFQVENRQTQHSTSACDCEDARDVTTHLPAGFIGNPHATPQCTQAEFAGDSCPVDSQVGIVHVGITYEDFLVFNAPLYNLVPPPEDPGLLGFKVFIFDAPQFTVITPRTGGDYGLDVKATSIFRGVILNSIAEDVWGVPADPSHDAFRVDPTKLAGSDAYDGKFCDANGALSTNDPRTVVKPCDINDTRGYSFEPIASNSPLTPFNQNPTTCGLSSLTTSLDVLAYDGGETHADSLYPATTGCDQLSFNPSQAISPTTTAADSPSGAEFRLTVPQFESPSVPSPSELRAATVTLPPGFALAPNVMNGKTTCTNAEARFGTTEEAQCPENAKLGTISVETPVLPGPLFGSVYLGEPRPGNRFRIFLVFDGFGVHVKLPGTVTPDPQTGQITISFDELPEVPFASFNMHVFGSERGPLATPTHCGTFPVSSVFTPWDAALSAQTSKQFFTIDQGPNGTPCPSGPRSFHPGFQAASAANTAAAHTAFSLNLTRNDGDQNLAGISLSTPPGFSATLKGIPYCPQAALNLLANPLYPGLAELASPACPPASQIGAVTTGVGAGTHPLYLPGKVYLAGPYRGAPLSLVAVIPAVSGPYDLGNVAVRAALRVNPETAQVTAVSDPLPQIFGGIPLRLRQILVNLNRPGFALNPTNCDPLSVSAQISGDEGAVSNPSENFQVSNCASLPFAPKLTTQVSGSTNHNGNPALKTELTFPQTGPNANVSRVSVTLPHSEFLDNAHIKSPCTRVQFSAAQCPPGSQLGFAKAETPLLEKPLEGPVYLRANGGERKLPDIVAQLKGQIDIQLVGFVESVHGQLRTTFQTVPDAPVSRFTLNLDGGNKGLLVNSINLCSATEHVNVQIDGQNGKTANQNPVLETPCGKRHKRKGHRAPRVQHSRRAQR